MIEKKNILIVCHNIKDLILLDRYSPNPNYFYVFASDDLRAQKRICEYQWINKITFIEKIESFYTVGEDVLRFEDAINNWLQILSEENWGFDSDLLFFERHVEGGVTSQRIQDALLLIRSYLSLIDKYLVTEIVLLRNNKTVWEDDVLVQSAKSRNLSIQEIGKNRIKVIMGRAKYWIKSLAYEPYYFLNYLMVRSTNIRQSRRVPQQNEVIVQLCDTAKKHSENVASILKSLDKDKYCSVALCWNAGRANELKEQGIVVDILEDYVSLRDWLSSFMRVIWTVTKLFGLKRSFLDIQKLSYLSVRLNQLLWYSICHLVIAQIGQRYRLMKAAKRYFYGHSPLAVSTWGINDLTEGKITLKSMNPNCKSMLFKFSLSMILLQSPYRIVYNPVDLYLVGGPYQKDFNVLALGKQADKVEMVGQGRYGGLDDFMKKFTPISSLKYLKIPTYFSRYILYDLSGSMRGYVSKAEINITLNGLIEMIKNHEGAALIVKPHPGSKKEDYWIPDETNNVFILDKNMLPYHALNCSDLLITKYSTLGIEAMLFSKPVISVILDNEKQWEVYKDAADYFYDIEDALSLLVKIIENDQFFKQWRINHMERQREFLKYCYGDTIKNSSLLISQAIEKHILIKKN